MKNLFPKVGVLSISIVLSIQSLFFLHYTGILPLFPYEDEAPDEGSVTEPVDQFFLVDESVIVFDRTITKIDLSRIEKITELTVEFEKIANVGKLCQMEVLKEINDGLYCQQFSDLTESELLKSVYFTFGDIKQISLSENYREGRRLYKEFVTIESLKASLLSDIHRSNN